MSIRGRPLGKTGLVVSELSLGTWGLSGDAYGPVEATVAEATIARALEMGFSLFDTADTYGGGAMEARLGKMLRGKPAVVVTKVGTDRTTEPARKRFDPAYLRASVTASLKRLEREPNQSPPPPQPEHGGHPARRGDRHAPRPEEGREDRALGGRRRGCGGGTRRESTKGPR